MKRSIAVWVLLLLINSLTIVDAYEPPTHREIGQRAAEPSVSSVDRVLKDELRLRAGIDETFRGRAVPQPRRVQQLIGDGAFFEDTPSLRSLRHFHNPLVDPWDGAGLFGIFQSSVLWQQNPAQDDRAGGGNWSWWDARAQYLSALTGSTTDARADAFAEMFEALGRLTHLAQDASVPAHVRNDPHLFYDGYERHVDRLQRGRQGSDRRKMFERVLNGLAVAPPLSIFTPTPHAGAPVPIARLIDTDTFTGENFGALSLASLGIAEYTNGNFLSDDTIFFDFALPSPLGLGENSDFFIRDGYERHVHRLQQAPAGSGRRARFDEWLNRAPVRPPDTIFGPIRHRRGRTLAPADVLMGREAT